MNYNELLFPPIFLVMIDDYANVWVTFDVDRSSEICRLRLLWFLVNCAVNHSVMKYVADWNHIRS